MNCQGTGMAVAVGAAWEDSRRSGLETGAGEVTAAAGTMDLSAGGAGIVLALDGEVEEPFAVESVEACWASAVAGVAEESRGVAGTVDWGASEAEAVRAVESVEVSGVLAEAGVVEASWGVTAGGVEVGVRLGVEVTAVRVEESGVEAPSLPVAGTACASDDVAGGVLSAVGVKSSPGGKAAGVPLTGVEEASGVGINRGGFSGAGLGTGLAGRWIR
jgi:hypothetical protein